MTKNTVKNNFKLNFQWKTQEPFLFCVHHNDQYPAGNSNLGLDKKHTTGRAIGQDFEVKDGFRMYHGNEVPGFPVHPHRGFETITIVRRGFIDHSDSLGAAGRYGEGDVQWMTAGEGVQHSEMFPLLHQNKENPVELFQIWLNLPQKNKMTKPHFTMFWHEDIPKLSLNNSTVELTLIAGEYADLKSLTPPPQSWANQTENEVNIWIIKIKINTESFSSHTGLELVSTDLVEVGASKADIEFLVLQAKPINEAIAQYGPFVMNQQKEIQQAIADYQRTQFGGWPWPMTDQVHGPALERFAKYPDGRIEKRKV